MYYRTNFYVYDVCVCCSVIHAGIAAVASGAEGLLAHITPLDARLTATTLQSEEFLTQMKTDWTKVRQDTSCTLPQRHS